MVLTGKPELTKFWKHLFYCRAIRPDGHTFQRVSKTHALQRLPLATFDQTDRMNISRDYAGLMLCRQLKSMNWMKTQMLVCFDKIFFVFFWLRCFLEINWKQLLIFSCLGLCCLWFLYFAALTCWPARLILCLNFCLLFLTLLPCQNTVLKNKNLYSSEDQLGLDFKINA